MNKRHLWTGFAAFTGIFVLILDSRTALTGAQDGILLCIRTVIPSLFPFFILSNLLTGAFMGMDLPLFRPLGQLFGLPKGAESLLIPAYLGGYPAGAHSICSVWKAGQLSKKSAEQLLAFCNNAGPAFLFGMIGQMFPSPAYPWALWGIHIAASWMVSLLRRADDSEAIITGKLGGITEAMGSSLSAMAAVCGWAILFRVLIAFLSRWILWLLPESAQIAVIGLLELSNGCCSLLSVGRIPIRFVLASVLLAAGGLCVTMQTASAAKGLSLKYYFAGKGLHILFSLILSASALYPWLLTSLLFTFLPLLMEKIRNNSRNPKTAGV